jgi:Lon protease-like protein
MTNVREDLPIFPLRLVLFPYAPLPLHIFEARYREMVREVLAGDRRFGVVMAHPEIDETAAGPIDIPERLTIATIGTVAEIRETTPYDDGRYDIVCTGHDRFKILATSNARAYLTATVEMLAEPLGLTPADTPAVLTTLAQDVKDALGAVIDSHSDASTHDETRRAQLQRINQAMPTNPTALAYFAARLLPTATDTERQQLLEAMTASRRLRLLRDHLRREARVAAQLGQMWEPAGETESERPLGLN